MRFAVSVRHTVTVASNPSGTFATMIPIMKTKLVIGSVPITKPRAKKMTPRIRAMAEMI